MPFMQSHTSFGYHQSQFLELRCSIGKLLLSGIFTYGKTHFPSILCESGTM